MNTVTISHEVALAAVAALRLEAKAIRRESRTAPSYADRETLEAKAAAKLEQANTIRRAVAGVEA